MMKDTPILILLMFSIYVISLFILRYSGFKDRIIYENCTNSCPKCSKALERIKRTELDHAISFLTFYIFNFKKYKCEFCNWQGLVSNRKTAKHK